MLRKINPDHYTPENVRFAFTVLVLVLLAGIGAAFWLVYSNSPNPPSAPAPTDPAVLEQMEAESTLVGFFNVLSQGRYAEALLLYGGDWETIGIYGGAERTPAALQKYCEATQTCLAIKQVVAGKQVAVDEHRFTIEFKKSNGELFTFGPFEEGAQPITQFDYTVKKQNDRWLVITPPQYAP